MAMPQPELQPPRITGTACADDRWAARLRGFGPVGIIVTVVILFGGTAWISALLVLLWARMSCTSVREMGFVPVRNWTQSVAGGIILGVALKLVMKALIMPLLGAAPVNQTWHYLVGNARAAAFMALFVTLSGGFGEETVYRGFLFHRFRKLFRNRAGATLTALVLSSLWFAAVHYPDQGVDGVKQAAITGLVFGTIFLITQSLIVPMVTHAAFDLTAIAIIYWNLEARVAHLVFR